MLTATDRPKADLAGLAPDVIADAIGNGWKGWLSSLRHGKGPNLFIIQIADKAVRQAASWRRAWRSETTQDAMSPLAQARNSFMAEQFDTNGQQSRASIYGNSHGQERMDALEEKYRKSEPAVRSCREWFSRKGESGRTEG